MNREQYERTVAALRSELGVISDSDAELLLACGIDRIRELSMRSPSRLHKRMLEQNDTFKLVRRLPTEATVAAWVARAKTLMDEEEG